MTVEEVALELRIRRDVVRRLLREGQLLGVRLSQNKNAVWRVYPPALRLRQLTLEREEHILHVPLFTTEEVGRLLKVQPATIRALVRDGRLQPEQRGVGRSSLFSAAEVRRLLWERERIHRRGRKFYSPWLMNFLKAALSADPQPTVEQLERLLAQVTAYLPDEERLPLMGTLWKYLEGINEILRRVREARSRPRAAPGGRRARSRPS